MGVKSATGTSRSVIMTVSPALTWSISELNIAFE
jgi:hypothetical protein